MKFLIRVSYLISASILITVLTGCGGGGSSDPMASYLNQTVEWSSCDLKRINSEEDITFAQQLASRLVCADIRAPINYADPSQGEINIALMVVRGANGRDDNPAILFNPGGPGVDGLPYGLKTAKTWASTGTSEDPFVVQSYQQLAQRFDLVGFSPRGIGWSTQLTCPRTQEPLEVDDPTRHLNPNNINKTLFNSQLIAQSCENQALMPFINSDATARDMDLIRHLLHQDKLNYIGLSYGTWLGNWYASLFPSHVGRMLFTGVTDFAIPLSHQNLIEDEIRQKVFDTVIIPYATKDPDPFGFNPPITTSSLRQLIDNFPDRLHSALVNEYIDNNLLSSASYANYAALTLRAGQAIDEALKNRVSDDEASLKAAMDNKLGPNPTERPKTFKEFARSFAQNLIERYIKPKYSDEGMYWSIICNDTGTDYTPDTWVAQSNQNAQLYPDFGGAVRENACLYWRKSNIARPIQQRAAQAGPILMLQSTLDPSTVLSGAMNSLSLLPNASMVLIDGEITHAPLPPYGTSCVDKPIVEYFLYGTVPPRMTTCSKLPIESFALTN